jgi:SOS-response transcriptional repressor LexA
MNENQQKILNFAKENNISSLSYREIAKRLNLSSPQIVIHHLEQLKKKGLIYFDKDKKQRIAKPKSFVVDNFFNIPIVGSANCGPAMELAQEQITGFLKISKRALNTSNGEGLIALKAVGQSLNKANIFGDSVNEGDYLIVDCKKQPKNHDYILSVIDGAANFKKFFKDDKKEEIRLVSESTLDIPPIILHKDDLETSGYLVNGVVIKVVKK